MSDPNFDPFSILNNGSYYGPVGETPMMIQLEKLFLASGYLTGMGFGMIFILYVACMQILWKEQRVRYSWFLMLYSTLLCATNLVLTATAYFGVQLAFIDNRNFPLGVFAFIELSAILPTNVVSVSMFVASNILADFLLLWRCHVIYRASLGGRAKYVMILPLLLAFGSTAMGILFDIVSAQPTGFFSAIAMKIALAYFSLTLTLNLLLTLMICLRIWGYQRLIRESLGADYGKQYTSITTMFIESAALYTAVSIAVLATFATGSTLSQIFLGIAPCCQMISSYFIIWRVANGRAWTQDTLTKVPSASRSMVFTKASRQHSQTNTFVASKTVLSGKDVDIPLHHLKSTSSFPDPENNSGKGVHVVQTTHSEWESR